MQKNAELLPDCLDKSCLYITEDLQKRWIYCCKVHLLNPKILEHTNSLFISSHQPFLKTKSYNRKNDNQDSQGNYLYIYLDSSLYVNQARMYKDMILNFFKDNKKENIIGCEILLSKPQYKNHYVFKKANPKETMRNRHALSIADIEFLQNTLRNLRHDKELYYSFKHAFTACLESQE